jgi:hypothetical protein
MKSHRVEQGDNITSIGFRYGFFPESLWNHPSNQDLKQLRINGDILFPGDVVNIPDLRPASQKKPTGQRHRFRRKGVPARLRIQLLDDHGPRAAQAYELSIDGHKLTGVTSGDGVLEVFVPPDAKQGQLQVGSDLYPLLFGHLDPISEIAGVKKRLNNLGFFCGPPDTGLDEATGIALRRFQRHLQLKVTGELDDTTRRELERIHDLPGIIPPIPLED